MKLAVSMWSFVRDSQQGKLDTEGFVRRAKELGADGVELLDFFWKDRNSEIGAVKAALRETGLPVCTWAVGNDFAGPDPAERKEALETVQCGVEEAVNLNSGIVRVFSGNLKEGVSYEQALDHIVHGLKAAAQYAVVHGVALGLENHGMLAGRSDQVRTIINTVGSPALGANIDTGNFLLVNQPPHEAVADLAGSTVSVHLKDFKEVPADSSETAYAALDGRRYAGTVIGAGDVDLRACLQSLKDAGYQGWLSIEYEGEEEPSEAVAASIENARWILAQLG